MPLEKDVKPGLGQVADTGEKADAVTVNMDWRDQEEKRLRRELRITSLHSAIQVRRVDESDEDTVKRAEEYYKFLNS